MTSALRKGGGWQKKQTRVLIGCVCVAVTRGEGEVESPENVADVICELSLGRLRRLWRGTPRVAEGLLIVVFFVLFVLLRLGLVVAVVVALVVVAAGPVRIGAAVAAPRVPVRR